MLVQVFLWTIGWLTQQLSHPGGPAWGFIDRFEDMRQITYLQILPLSAQRSLIHQSSVFSGLPAGHVCCLGPERRILLLDGPGPCSWMAGWDWEWDFLLLVPQARRTFRPAISHVYVRKCLKPCSLPQTMPQNLQE